MDEIVIARYAELDVAAWLGAALAIAPPTCRGLSIHVYDKATRDADALDADVVRDAMRGAAAATAGDAIAVDVRVERRLNVGRAAETFLHHMAKHHAHYAAEEAEGGVPRVVVFVSGRPAPALRNDASPVPRAEARAVTLWEHVHAARTAACGTSVECALRAQMGSAPSREVHAATPSFCVREWRRATVEVPLEISTLDAWYRRRVGAPFPTHGARVAWWTDGVFAATTACLAARADPAWCAAMRADVATHDHPVAAHYLDRAWAHLLSGDAAIVA